ncbi:hypothetical protein GCM10009810_19630 [Nostocoides vanveenii]|uniref:Uncharacterized protein n=2 Tax=Nostocoides vanveenii TaxID=330835 RepID=A0ABP4WQI1_9MICO
MPSNDNSIATDIESSDEHESDWTNTDPRIKGIRRARRAEAVKRRRAHAQEAAASTEPVAARPRRGSRLNPRQISLRAGLRDRPDAHRLARAVLDLAVAQTEAEARHAQATSKTADPEQTHD